MSENIMYVDESSLTHHPNDDYPIIRYMSLTKFLALITSESIWFARPDTFSDEYDSRAINDGTGDAIDYFSRSTYISCWNCYTRENFALWATYLDGDKYGVAIISTVGDFKKCIIGDEDREKIESYLVRYVPDDYKTDLINHDTMVSTKKDFYASEEEIRMGYRDWQGDWKLQTGFKVNIAPRTLIKKAIWSSYMPDHIKDSVLNILSKFGYDFPINDSKVRDRLLKP